MLRFDHSIRVPFERQDLEAVRQQQPLNFLKPTDATTPILMDTLTNGETLREATFYWYREVAAVEMAGVFPQETVSLLYERITWTITDGNISYTDIRLKHQRRPKETTLR